MCGLFGWNLQADTASAEQRGTLGAVLMFANEQRGKDSWGYAEGTGRIDRGVGRITKGITANVLSKHFLVLGHTRAATTGVVSLENAHPFVAQNSKDALVGAHNGVISNHAALNTQYKRAYTVDSQHLFGHIAEHRDLSELHGFGAATWLWKRTPSVVKVAVFDGDLCILGVGEPKHTIGVIWSSTPYAANSAARIAGLKTFEYAIKEHKVYEMTSHGVYETKEPFNVSPAWPTVFNFGHTGMDQKPKRAWYRPLLPDVGKDDWGDIDYDDEEPCELCSVMTPFDEFTRIDGMLVCRTCVMVESTYTEDMEILGP